MVDMGVDGVCYPFSLENRPSAHQFECDHPKRKDIGPTVGGLVLQFFQGEIVEHRLCDDSLILKAIPDIAIHVDAKVCDDRTEMAPIEFLFSALGR